MIGSEEGVRELVAAGVDIENINYGGALSYAAWWSNSKIICEFLIESGAKLDTVDGICGRTALHGFAKHGWCDLIELCIAGGCPVDQLDNRTGHTPLSLACHYEHVNAIKLLVAQGADPR